MNSTAKLGLTLALLALSTANARADWPAQRHDAARTATGDASSRITQPALAFRYYLGGSLGRQQLLVEDVDGNGTRDAVLVAGGALVARTSDDFVIWETEPLDVFRIDAIADLDGDGTPEFVASAAGGRLYLVDASTGTVLWRLPSGVVGNVGAVRLADFDRDGHLDVYVAEYANGSSGSRGDVGRAYSFAGDVTAPTILFELERGRRDYISGENDTVADVDGDGQLEVIAVGSQAFYVYSGVDGRLISASDNVGWIPFGHAILEVANVDGDAQTEFVAYTDNGYTAPLHSRRVFLMDWDTTLGRLVLRWERSATDLVIDKHAFGPGGVADLGNDGTIEVVTSFLNGASSTWTTCVLDAATGAERASVARGPFRGLADLDGDGSPEIITGDRTSDVAALRWTAGALATMFVVPHFEPVLVRARDATAPSAAGDALLAFDLDRTSPNELVGLAYSPDDTVPTALVALAATSDPPTEVARLPLEAGVAVLMTATAGPITRSYPQLAIARSDGYLWFLDDTLHATNADATAEVPRRGLRIGGYYSGASGIAQVPLAADLDGVPGAELVVRNSIGGLMRLSPLGATIVESPRVDWEISNASTPVLADLDGDGQPEVVHWTSEIPAQIHAVRASDASLLWQRTLGATDTAAANDLMVGDLDGDGRRDVVYSTYTTSGGSLRINALSGITGTKVWPADYAMVVAGYGYGVGSLWDRDGDGALDVLACPRDLLQWLRGQDGTPGTSAGAGYPSYGIVRDVGDGDVAAEVTSSGTASGVRSHELDLTQRWSSIPSTSAHVRVNGAIADCPDDGPVFVEGYYASPRLSAWRLATGELVGDIALRSGAVWAPPATAPEGTGRLGNVTMSPNLRGDGRPAALVPSTDGHLYAIDPCTMTLAWAIDLHYPVGEAILADTDGDGEDEIVVTTADGFLYGIDNEVFPAPEFVYENDGTRLANNTAEDVDEYFTRDTLHANWAPVEAALSYEYAVITLAGTYLTTPPFVSAGSDTSASPTGLLLVPGSRYLFAVRAIGADGPSSVTLSDGVIVFNDGCAACSAVEICVDGGCIADPCAGVVCDVGTTCIEGTCVVGPDGGPSPPPDAGIPPAVDAGTRSELDAGAPAETDGGPRIVPRLVCWGCGSCSLIPDYSDSPAPLAALGGLAALVLVRRRRGR